MKHAAILFALAWPALTGCEGRITDSDPLPPSANVALRQEITRWGIVPMGPMPTQNPAQVALGRALFFDKILSGNRDVACATCHQPTSSLGDGLSLAIGTGATGEGSSRSPGHDRTFVARHAPSLLNSGLGMTYVFWDGRLNRFGPEPFPVEPGLRDQKLTVLPTSSSNVLIAQALLPVLSRSEMRGAIGDRDVFGKTNELALFDDDQPRQVWEAVMQRLLAIPEYVELFRAAFPGTPASALTFEHAARALATFLMEAFTKTHSPFDRFLDRDDTALSAEQRQGAQLFFGKAQCSSCHNGPFLGGQGFANVGAPQIGPGGTREAPLDLGRGELHNNEFYRFAFRVAPLRNVELTAPYMHSGAYASLEAVVNHYNNVPLALRTFEVSQLAPALRSQHHGDARTINAVLANLDGRLRAPLDLNAEEKRALVGFLRSLTDPAAKDLAGVAPIRVPSGLPVRP